MDIHRSRFVPYPTSPINAISFSRSSDKGVTEPKPTLKLAIGRADGSIEIWNPDRGHWVQETVFPGGEGRSIEGLVWTQDPNDTDADDKPILGQLRLFSIASSSSVTEWHLGTGRPLRTSTGNFSEVWCLAAQPRWRTGKGTEAPKDDTIWTGQDLVAGCGDGTLAVLTTVDSDLTFKRFLARAGSKKTRCVSVIWQNRERIVAGFSDSNIRVYDARNGTLLRTMSLGVGIPGAPKDILVWRVKCLPGGDIVSADSNGELRFWDGRTYSMTQRISGHDSDCLDIVTSTDGQTVFSGGIDGKIAAYKLTSRDGEKRRWAKLSHRRIHRGDIKSMAVFDSKQMSVVVSGGADTEPAVLPLREMNRENHRRLPGLPQNQPCASAPNARLLVSWWERQVCVWRIGSQEISGLTLDNRSRQLVLKLCISGEENITSAAISNDGRLLTVSTLTATKSFQLRQSKRQDDRLRASPIELPLDVSKSGSKCAAISPDGRWLAIVCLSNDIKVMRVTTKQEDAQHLEVVKDSAELDRVYRKTMGQTGLKSYDSSINRLIFSPDSDLLCASDVSGHIDTYALDGDFDATAAPSVRVKPQKNTKKTAARPTASDSDSDDSPEDEDDFPLSFFGQSWTESPIALKLPRCESAPLIMSFHPSPPNRHLMVVITQHHQIYEFDMRAGKLSDWSRRNPTGTMPPELRGIKERVTGLIWDPRPPPLALTNGAQDSVQDSSRNERIWLHGSSWLAMLDISQEFSSAISSSEPQDNLSLTTTTDDDDEDMDAEAMDIDDAAAAAGPLRKLDTSDESDGETKHAVLPRRRWWCTYKYRPILGVVPLGGNGAGDEEQEHRPVEVVLIERPLWDLEASRGE
ncbi:hypothetical protein ANO11243_064550 [Dothideomycetidae sp. 11243]|nr:hypothetical protein ANO11243_064550 [fungal sp. No.11243]